MSEHERAPDPEQLERLRAAFAAAEPPAKRDPSLAPIEPERIWPERIWAAARGELGIEETAAIVDRLHLDPQLALEWRLAVELSNPRPAEPVAAANDRGYLTVVGALAAVAAAAVLLLVIIPQPQSESDSPKPGLRGGAGEQLLSTPLAEGVEISREDFELSWSAVEGIGRYELRISTEALDPVYEALELVEPRARVPAEVLVDLEPGDVLIWQVDVVMTDGARVSGPPWRVVLR